MPPFIVDNRVDTLGMKEENGVVRSLTKRCRIGGLTSTDEQVLVRAYELLGLPTPGTFLVNNTNPLNPTITTPPGRSQGLSQLLLSGREFSLVEQDKATVDVTMEWRHFMDGDNQNLTRSAQSPNGWKVPAGQAIWGKWRASVQQSKSNFFDSRAPSAPEFNPFGSYEVGDVVMYKDIFWFCVEPAAVGVPPYDAVTQLPPPPGLKNFPVGALWSPIADYLMPQTLPANQAIRRQLQVGHKFPHSDQNVADQTFFQTGEITYMQPSENFKLHGQVFTRSPRSIKNLLKGAINSLPWMDEPAYAWMCTEVSYEPLYVRWQWKMTFEFQQNEDTWLPTAVFNDQRIGRPPSGLVENLGFRSVHKHPELDMERYFNRVFGVFPSLGF